MCKKCVEIVKKLDFCKFITILCGNICIRKNRYLTNDFLSFIIVMSRRVLGVAIFFSHLMKKSSTTSAEPSDLRTSSVSRFVELLTAQ